MHDGKANGQARSPVQLMFSSASICSLIASNNETNEVAMNEIRVVNMKQSRSSRLSIRSKSAISGPPTVVRFSGGDHSKVRPGHGRVEQKALSTEPSDSSEDPRFIQQFEFKRSGRPSSRRLLKTELSLQDLEKLLCEEIPKWLPGSMEILGEYGNASQFRGLAERCKLDNFSQSNSGRQSSQQSLSSTTAMDELSRVVDWLGVVILQDASVASEFPSRILSEIHFSIGLVRNTQADFQGAQRSFLNSLWILSSSITCSSKWLGFSVADQERLISKEQIASVMICLGGTYGSLGDRQQMKAVITAAEELMLI